MTKWKHISTVTDAQRLELVPGHNIWDYKWRALLRDPPPPRTGDQWTDMQAPYEHALVIDPLYGKEKMFRIYEVTVDGRVIRFAASEFSNCVWGFYLPDESAT